MKKIFGILIAVLMASFMVACATPEEKSMRSLQELYEDMELINPTLSNNTSIRNYSKV